jgi:hypothetical protein
MQQTQQIKQTQINYFYNFLIVLFIVTFICDLILNFLSRQSFVPRSIKALKSYFDYYNNITLTGVYASITVIVCYLITALVTYFLFHFYVPSSINQLYIFLLIAAPVGYISDIIIYKAKIFGSQLDTFYKIIGAGLSGALAFIFAIVITFFTFYLYVF